MDDNGWNMNTHGITESAENRGTIVSRRYLKWKIHTMNSPNKVKRYNAYRAPKGGMVVRGTFYPGGRTVPNMQGAFVQSNLINAFRDRLKSRLAQSKSTNDQRTPPRLPHRPI